MRPFSALLGLGLILGASSIACDKPAEDASLFQADLSGAGENPARSTPAVGTVGLYVNGNTVDYTIEVHGITNVTGAHIHSGAAGSNGSIRIALFPATGHEFPARRPDRCHRRRHPHLRILRLFAGHRRDLRRAAERDARGNGLRQRPHHAVPRRGDPRTSPTHPLIAVPASASFGG